MRYAAYLLCLGLIAPAVAMGAMSLLMATEQAGFFGSIWEVGKILFFFMPGLEDPVHEGWRIVVWLAGVCAVLGIGAIRQLKTLVFWGLGILGTTGIAATLFAASREGLEGALVASLFLLPSIAGVGACMWFTVKFESS